MPALRELQTAFRQCLLGDVNGAASAALDAWIAADGLAANARIAIYRHHVRDTLTVVLQSAYPVTSRLVHERFFAYAVDHYIRESPPAGPCLAEYGASLPVFLEHFPPCRELAYLPDVARLEWALHTAIHAADAVPLPLSALRQLSVDAMMQATFRFHPAMTFLESPWPIDRIWRVNQLDADPAATIDLASGGVCLEILREGEEAAFHRLAPAEYALRHALAEGARLEAAAAAALDQDPSFDLAAALRALLASDVLVASSAQCLDDRR